MRVRNNPVTPLAAVVRAGLLAGAAGPSAWMRSTT